MHIIQRGNNRMSLFLNDEDFSMCALLLRESSEREGCAIHSYALMGNHWHLLTTPERPNSPARMMQSVGFRYARYFNFRYERTGAVFEGRYRSMMIDSERYFFACSRYIELNPVRALLANHPGEYKWSSFRSNVGAKFDPMMTAHSLYHSLGDTMADRRTAYLALFDIAIDPGIVNAIREATNAGRDVSETAIGDRPRQKRTWSTGRFSRGGDRRSAKYESFVGKQVDQL